MYFTHPEGCQEECWECVKNVTFCPESDSKNDLNYFDCVDSVRTFLWRDRPSHAPWDSWFQRRVVLPDEIVLVPSSENVTSSTYYDDICSWTPGLISGILLLCVVSAIVFAFMCGLFQSRRRDRSLSTKQARPTATHFSVVSAAISRV